MATLAGVSELVPHSDLNLPRGVEDAVVSAARHTKRAAAGIAVDSAKDMAIEGVGNVHL
jgi:hypothetical protein